MASYPADVEEYIKSKVDTGEFDSEDAFISKATRLYRELETRHAQLKSDVRAAIDEVQEGNSVPLDIEAIKQGLANELDEQGMPH